jgi:hypothetical protein
MIPSTKERACRRAHPVIDPAPSYDDSLVPARPGRRSTSKRPARTGQRSTLTRSITSMLDLMARSTSSSTATNLPGTSSRQLPRRALAVCRGDRSGRPSSRATPPGTPRDDAQSHGQRTASRPRCHPRDEAGVSSWPDTPEGPDKSWDPPVRPAHCDPLTTLDACRSSSGLAATRTAAGLGTGDPNP